MGQTVVEKIAERHMTEGPEGRPVRAGDFVTVRPRHVMTHDNTAAVMKKFAAIGAPRVRDPRQPVFALDHDIQNRSSTNLAKYRDIEAFARQHGIDFHPAGTGIGHQVMCERLYAVPEALVVASDSHSNMYGAMGALGTPVVRTDAAAIWATGTFWWQVPPTVQVVLVGSLPGGTTGKDVIVTLCGRYGNGEVLNAAVEFAGPGVSTLSMDQRMTIANMSTEWGALVGWFPIDAVTLGYVESRRAVLGEEGSARVSDAEVERWRRGPLSPDPDASYAARIRLDLSTVSPHVSGPDSVQVMGALADLEARRIPIQKAYLVSCVNSRVEDLAAAARAIAGRRVAEGVELYVSAASAEVQREAERLGHWGTLLEAGASPLPPGCGPCIGLGAGLLEPGEVGISATNRNFKGRMGSRDARCYLASPEVVAASAAAGRIAGPGETARRDLDTTWEPLQAVEGPDEATRILPGFPETIAGRVLFVPQDNLNTDGIYGKDYTYREDMTPEAMAAVVMQNYDPQFAGIVKSGDILVGARNFGTGSSREQAATALHAAGVRLIVAASFSQTFLRNAFNNGFPCIECPALVTRLREAFRKSLEAGTKTIVAGDVLDVDFARGSARFRESSFRFAPLGSVPQKLVVAGGVESLVRAQM